MRFTLQCFSFIQVFEGEVGVDQVELRNYNSYVFMESGDAISMSFSIIRMLYLSLVSYSLMLNIYIVQACKTRTNFYNSSLYQSY